jgi:hypothetical protein
MVGFFASHSKLLFKRSLLMYYIRYCHIKCIHHRYKFGNTFLLLLIKYELIFVFIKCVISC